MRKYEIIIDNIYSYRTLIQITNEKELENINKADLYRKYRECKERLIKWLNDTEEEYNISLFGKKYSIDVAASIIKIG